MKKTLIPLIIILAMVFMNANIFSTTYTIQAGGFSFSPSTVNVAVGDTIKWAWLNGTHTTTSVTVPTGAAAWDNPLDNSHTSFSYVVHVGGQYNYQCNFHYMMGMTGVINASVTGIKPLSNLVPDKFQLYQNYPNPFNPTTNIKFDIAKNSVVKLTIFDMNGKEIVTLLNGELQPGTYSIDWNGSNYSSGVYFYKLELPGFTETRKLMLLK